MSDTMMMAIANVAEVFIAFAASTKLILYRIEQLEKKVEKHNQVVERVYRLEDNDKLLDEKISTLSNRVTEIVKGAS
jgi:hypothetical protein